MTQMTSMPSESWRGSESSRLTAGVVATRILSVLEATRNASAAAVDVAAPAAEAALLLARIMAAVRAARPVTLVILGFPAKSPNRQKTLGDSADWGEVLGLRFLQDLCVRIAAIYPPGAYLRVCSDGHVFADLVGVSDTIVDSYHASIGKIIADERFDRLTTFAMADVYRDYTAAGMRRNLVAAYAASPLAIRADVAGLPNTRLMFNGIHRFLFEDGLVLQTGMSRNQVRTKTKDLAYEVIRRSDAFSRLVAETFPEAVRLSIHPHPVGSGKIGVKLVPGGDRWATPWHNVPVLKNGRFTLMKRVEAESLGATLRWKSGRYAFFDCDGEST